MRGDRRAVLVRTVLALAVFAGALSLLSWDRANQVAGVVAAVIGVAALGVGVCALLAPSGGTSVRVSRTGRATATAGGDANTGAVASPVADAVCVGETGDVRPAAVQAPPSPCPSTGRRQPRKRPQLPDNRRAHTSQLDTPRVNLGVQPVKPS